MADNFFGKLFGGDDKKPTPPSNTPKPAQPATMPPRPINPAISNYQPPRQQPPAPPRPAAVPPSSVPPSQRPPVGGAPMPPKPAVPRPMGQNMGGGGYQPNFQPGNSNKPISSGHSNVQEGELSIDDLLKMIVDKAGSDLHLTVGSPPMLRLQGKLWPTDLPPLSPKEIRRLVYNFLTNDQREKLERDLELDISYELKGVARYRCNVFFTRLGMGAVFRVIPTRIKTLAELRLPLVLGDLARRNKGLILVTGPTGSGKSTTLAAMVDQVNNERQDHILTIEDPIEFVHQHKQCIVNQREIGPNTKSFANALRSALREDPDIILVGEMRDYETISLAVTAAETGHLVFATLHTPSAAQSVDRIVDVFPAHQQAQIRTQLADALQGIIAQQLIPTVDGQRRECALEIMINTPAVANLIRDNKTFQLTSIMQTSKQQGMQTMDQALMDLVKSRKISPQEAYRRALDKKAFEQYKPRDF